MWGDFPVSHPWFVPDIGRGTTCKTIEVILEEHQPRQLVMDLADVETAHPKFFLADRRFLNASPDDGYSVRPSNNLPTVDERNWHPHLDFVDNPSQLNVIRHHYEKEFLDGDASEEVLQDYREDSVIYTVVDGQPVTYRGLAGARRANQEISSLLLHHQPREGERLELDFEHVSVQGNHAQVVWKAETENHKTSIWGTDSFEFDEDNHIAQQTVVALTERSDD